MVAAQLEVTGLAAGYGETQVLFDLSFTLPARSRLAVLGRNGVGKTTLLATLMGLTRRTGGRIVLEGQDVAALTSAARAHLGFGYVPQTRDVFRSLTVEENLLAGLKGRPRAAVEEAFALFPRLKERRRNASGTLSGGEQQMLSTARTLLGQPTLLLLDEPLEGLAPVICDELMAALDRLTRERSLSVILVEQQIDRAIDFAETVIFMDRGRVVRSATASELRADSSIVERHAGVSVH